jgi:cyclohexa-1,5-dienecarbonyl-CoA hydratase
MTTEIAINDGIGEIVINNPPLNILTREVMQQLRDGVAGLQQERTLRVLILRAEGKHFSAGADVGEHMPPDYEAMIPEFIETIAAVDAFPLPVIAAVQGRCLGGGFELIQPADFVVAGEGSQLGQPEIMLGVIPPAACAILPQICVPSAAAEIVFTGDAVAAGRAAQLGFVWKVVADDAVRTEAVTLAQRIARHSAAALRIAKRALRQGFAAARLGALRESGRIYVDELMNTEDAVEGLTAFTEKRTAEWKHR